MTLSSLMPSCGKSWRNVSDVGLPRRKRQKVPVGSPVVETARTTVDCVREG